MSLTLNLHDFLPDSRANGPGKRFVIWLQGCAKRCPGCFNPGAQEIVERKIVDIAVLNEQIQSDHSLDGVTFSGGEPFLQSEALAALARTLRDQGLTTVCFTGYTIEEIRNSSNKHWLALLSQIDLLIDGPYVRELACSLPLVGSSNQRAWFLSGKILPAEIEELPIEEISLCSDGELVVTGFAEIGLEDDSVFGEGKGSNDSDKQ